MPGSTFGTLFRVTTWGESHGKGVGVVVDGCPAGLKLCEEDVQSFLDRRKPGQHKYTTARSEADAVEILSGVFEGKTTGTPISMMVCNNDQRSGDYGDIAEYYRPGHADLTFDRKYGFRDYRGGGRSSGRETVGRVAAGAIASAILEQLGIRIRAFTAAIGDITCDPKCDPSCAAESQLYMPDPEAEKRALVYLDECMKNQTSSGGVITCIVTGMKPGVGEPVFDKLDACLGKALFSIGAVKAVEIGDGVAAAVSLGHENNDQYRMCDGRPVKTTNHAGGILGGISDGSSIVIRTTFKPTPSIFREQSALCRDGSCREIRIKGRHDPVIVPRAVVVVESMTAITILDLLMQNMCARMEHLKKIYE